MQQVQIFQSSDGVISLEVALEHETVWLSQAQMCELFDRDQSVLSRHIRNVFKEGELNPEGNMQKVHIASSDKPLARYSLDVIISVGYRVKSLRGVQFRRWAISVLKQHLVQGYFLWYLRLNQPLLARPVERMVNDNTLVALALLVAESLPAQKELMIRLIEHFVLLKSPLGGGGGGGIV